MMTILIAVASFFVGFAFGQHQKQKQLAERARQRRSMKDNQKKQRDMNKR